MNHRPQGACAQRGIIGTSRSEAGCGPIGRVLGPGQANRRVFQKAAGISMGLEQLFDAATQLCVRAARFGNKGIPLGRRFPFQGCQKDISFVHFASPHSKVGIRDRLHGALHCA